MAAWLAAFLGGALLAVLQYARRDGRSGAPVLAAALLRGAAATTIAALALDAPAGPARRLPPVVALDASASWLRGGDTAAWHAARDTAAGTGMDSTFLFGDSLRPRGAAASTPTDRASRVGPAVERALGLGRPLTVVTDGEIADPDALAALPAGSRVVVVPRRVHSDVAVGGIEAPRAVVGGDTIEARVTVAAGGAGAPAGTVSLMLDERPLAGAPTAALAAYAERSLTLRARIAADRVGPRVLRAIVTTPGDAEPRNDTLAVAVQIARAAGAVFISTAPNPDARFALTVLRGALSIPTRGYYRVAPGAWRADGTLTPVAETDVRAAMRDAPMVVLHGDTALFGPPRTVTGAALALVVAPLPDDGEWYATGAPPSPLSSALSGLLWDSLPPLDASAVEPRGDWAGLETRRGRSGERRVVIAGWERSQRVVVVSVSGLSGWRTRGGAPADAFAALWGGVFDWLASGRADRRGVVPEAGQRREGDPIRWRRGAATDSVVRIALRRRAPGSPRDSLTLRFAPNASIAETPPLPQGLYDATVPGGQAVIAVNVSSEWLPRAPRVRSGAIPGARARATAPGLRNARWAYAAALALLCGEWLLRRRRGMR
jgi:hypothetical protein